MAQPLAVGPAGTCEHERIGVLYSTTVTAVVEDGQVSRVRVWDQYLRGPIRVECLDCGTDLPADHEASRVADGTEEFWPAWEIG